MNALVVVPPEELQRLIAKAVDEALDARARASSLNGAGEHLTVAEVACVLHCSARHVRRQVETNRLHAVKRSPSPGGRLLITRASLETFLKRGEI